LSLDCVAGIVVFGLEGALGLVALEGLVLLTAVTLGESFGGVTIEATV